MYSALYLVQSKGLGQSEAPSLFKSSSDHSGAGGWGGRRQSKRVGEMYSTKLHADVHLIYSTVEQWQLGNRVH